MSATIGATTFENANCTLYDPEVFFPPKTDRAALAYAKSLCAGCPVQMACLEVAMQSENASHQYRFGVFGGLSPRQRSKLHTAWKASAA